MENDLPTSSSSRTRSIFVGKIIIVLLLSCLIGYYVWKDSVYKYDAGQNLTFEQYQQDFEKYKQEQTEKPGELWLDIVIANMVFFFCFALYEALGHGLGFLITGLNKDKPSDMLNL